MPNNKPVSASPYEALISSIRKDECVSYGIHFKHIGYPDNVYWMGWFCDGDFALAGPDVKENAQVIVVSYDDARNFKAIMAKALADKKVIIDRSTSEQPKGEQPQLSADASWTILNIDAAPKKRYCHTWVRREGIFFNIDGSNPVMLRDEHEAILGKIYYDIQRDAIKYIKRNISSAEENLAAARHEMEAAEDALSYYKSLAASLPPELRLMLEID